MPVAIQPPTKPLAPSLKRRAHALVQPVGKQVSSISFADLNVPKNALASIIREAASVPPSLADADRSTRAKHVQSNILSLSHVSTLWRGVSLSIPELWLHLLISELDSDVNEMEQPLYSRKPWLNELFRRSNPLPVDIGLTGYNYLPRDPFLVGLELEYLPRIRTYRALVDERGWETLSSSLGEPAPLIESLSLVYRPSTLKAPSRFDTDESAAPQLPKNLFAGHAPRLTKLSLRGCLISQADFSPSVRANLTSLTVSQVSGPGIPTADRWLSYLSGMPLLEHLALEEGAIAMSVRQKRGSIPKPPAVAVELTALRSLSLEGHVDAVAIMLQRLAVPMDATISTVCHEVQNQDAVDVVVGVFARGLEHAAMGEDEACEAVSLLTLKGCDTQLEVTDGTRRRRLVLNFSRDTTAGSNSTPLWEEYLTKFLSLTPFAVSALTALEVQLPATPRSLVKSLTGACQLERLTNLNGASAKLLLPLLQKDVATASKSAAASPTASPILSDSNSFSSLSPLPLLPALHTLHFGSNDAFWGPSWSHVQAYLKWRALGWRAIRVVHAPLTGGVPEEAASFLRRLNISLVYGN